MAVTAELFSDNAENEIFDPGIKTQQTIAVQLIHVDCGRRKTGSAWRLSAMDSRFGKRLPSVLAGAKTRYWFPDYVPLSATQFMTPRRKGKSPGPPLFQRGNALKSALLTKAYKQDWSGVSARQT